MIVLFVLLILTVVALVGAVAVGWGGSLPDPSRDGAPLGLPEGPLSSEDLSGLRFAVVARGYRMDQVDAVLDRLREELASRDAQLGSLRTAADLPSTGEQTPWPS